MMIVEQGKVVEFSSESGEYVYDTSTEPSIMYGDDLSANVRKRLSKLESVSHLVESLLKINVCIISIKKKSLAISTEHLRQFLPCH
ncbi:hypothetical protein LSPH24S_02791 [Lysinibacillus sphaericus]